MLAGVVEIDDLDGVGEVLGGEAQIQRAPSPMTTTLASRSTPRRTASA
ncbi:MAG: hypothetical protein ABIZ71_01110 [Gemmatimonadales bacterium]